MHVGRSELDKERQQLLGIQLARAIGIETLEDAVNVPLLPQVVSVPDDRFSRRRVRDRALGVARELHRVGVDRRRPLHQVVERLLARREVGVQVSEQRAQLVPVKHVILVEVELGKPAIDLRLDLLRASICPLLQGQQLLLLLGNL